MDTLKKFDCQNIISYIKKLYKTDHNIKKNKLFPDLKIICKNKNRKENEKIRCECTTSEVHEEHSLLDELYLDIRTFICFTGNCLLNHDRSHRRMSKYNWNKVQKYNNTYKETIHLIANVLLQSDNKSIHETEETIKMQQCEFCKNAKLDGIMHTHFIKETSNLTESCEIKQKESYKPIEEIFDKIDKLAMDNIGNIFSHENENITRSKVQQTKCYRMTYGDINYLGCNKALFYFNRGIGGLQTFTNSMYPLKQQPSYKDLVVIDDIVFTAPCRCDSSSQHNRMFPHYRVTCAPGLTCPARFNNMEKQIHKIKNNAFSVQYTKASSMLIRYWR